MNPCRYTLLLRPAKLINADTVLRPVRYWSLNFGVTLCLLAGSVQGQAETLPFNTALQPPRDTVAHTELTHIDLDDLVQRAILTHPTVLAAKYNIDAADSDVVVAKRQRYPTIGLNSQATTAGPNTYLTVNQPVWSFGRIESKIAGAKASQGYYKSDYAVQQYTLADKTANAWQIFMAASYKILVSENQIMQLTKYQQMMQRRVAAGVSARIELDLVNSRLLQAQVQHDNALSMQKIGITQLQELIGEPIPERSWRTSRNLSDLLAMHLDAKDPTEGQNFQTIGAHDPSVIKADYQAQIAKAQFDLQQASRWPTVFLQYQKPLAGHQVSSYFGLGMQYDSGPGFSYTAQSQAASSRLNAAEMQREAARRLVAEQIQSDWQAYVSARNQARELDVAAQGAGLVQASYERQFIAGRKSWLEVLNAVQEVGQQQYALIDARINMILQNFKIKLHSGQLAWQQEPTP